MPRVFFIEKAHKDNPACKKGESYYHWKFRDGTKNYSRTRPKPSQLVPATFLRAVYELNDRIETLEALSIDSLRCRVGELSDAFRTLGDEQRGRDEGVLELNRRRAEECGDVADRLEGLASNQDAEDRNPEGWLEALLDEIHAVRYEGN